MTDTVRDTHRPEYAPLGLIGVLTPQANTTVEPEFAILCPPGYGFINARLTSPDLDMEARAAHYGQTVESQVEQFAEAPIDVVALAITGSSYLIGREREDALVEGMLTDQGLPLVTAGRAVCDALDALGAKNILLLSPYPGSLTEKSVGYWQSRGYEVDEVVPVINPAEGGHPIYSLTGDAANLALQGVRRSTADAIVMLGTGMPTLGPIAQASGWKGPPVLSSTLCLAWRALAACAGRSPDASDLADWVAAKHWRDALNATMAIGAKDKGSGSGGGT